MRARPPTTAAFLRRAVALLEAEAPAAFHRLVDELRSGAVRLEVGDERFTVEVRDGRARVLRRGTLPPAGRVAVREGVVLDLVDGRLDLLGAVEAGRLDVRGDCDTVLRLARALTAFVEGAVRSSSVRALLDEYRATRPVAATGGG